MKVELHYGKGRISLEIPEANIEQIIRPWRQETTTNNVLVLQQALTGKEFNDFQNIAAGKHLCVLVDDGTRDVPFYDILEKLFIALRKSSQVRFLICTGTHEPETRENKRITAFRTNFYQLFRNN